MTVAVLDNCTGCGCCVATCPVNAISLEAEFANGFGSKVAVVNARLCTNCTDCLNACPHQALTLNSG
ncbi:MAG: 4Fe-4S binding protein [Deltaproteobacteria bacterium]|nr:4Fe-4S binding protein [Deltaproteobacteria bacterium]MCW8893516.1 4Fe-4S binding protein [Deltaproteobacteria bacterium]MCW9049585.1 4Fe-4S binding protein [Deltaproteobacteria bacterium]